MSAETIGIQLMGVIARHPKVSNAMFRFTKWGNPFAEERYRWPYPTYERMSSDGPVVYSRLYRQWLVFGHDEIRDVLRSENTSNAKVAETLLELPAYRRLTPQVRADVQRWLLIQDGPDHARMRSAVARAFTPKASQHHEATAEQVVSSLLAELPQAGNVDLVESFTARLPIHVIAALLGLPVERWAWLRQLSSSLGALIDLVSRFDPAVVNRDVAELHEFFASVVADRRRNPQDDLISALVAEDDGGVLTDEEVITMIGFLLFAGHETMTGSLGNAILALERFPAQKALLRSNPELIAGAVEELLRFDPAVQTTGRTSTGPIDVGSVTIPANAVIGLFTAAANRDPRRWTEPDQLQLDRPHVSSATFGHGIHHCLGASLARLEMRCAIPPLLQRLGNATIDVACVEWKRSITFRGPVRMPVRMG